MDYLRKSGVLVDQLIELGVSSALAKSLSDDGWTPDVIATADVNSLTAYKGVGRTTALKWIRAARLKINQRKLSEGLAMERAEGFRHITPAAPGAEPPEMSVRVKRIQEGKR